jgi:erythromycin esterase-like protein
MTTGTARLRLDELGIEATPLEGAREDLDPLLRRIGDARLVLLGEATHGTHEFQRLRAQITKRLVLEAGFAAVAVEADWPDAWRVNRFVRGLGSDVDAVDALGDFERFPSWMWRNADVLDFVGWLRAHNDSIAQRRDARGRTGRGVPAVGFYGLDLYSLHASIRKVLAYLDLVDPEAAARARTRYACFDHFGDDLEAYGMSASIGLDLSCAEAALAQLVDMRAQAAAHGEASDLDEQFQAEQNARLVRDAEQYYRTMFHGRVAAWNARDAHMANTIAALREQLPRLGAPPKIVVWEHNSHLGDARATEMGRQGEWNVGQLARESFGSEDVVLVGFTTHHGTVTAASDWGGSAERRRVLPALAGSWEALFHASGMRRFLALMADRNVAGGPDAAPRLERAIGVVYRPETERESHWFEAALPRQFDAVIHLDETRAVEPLERTARWDRGHPDTYPSGM